MPVENCWVWGYTMMGHRLPKSTKPETSFITEKERKRSPCNTQWLSAIVETTAGDQAPVAVAMG